PMILSAIGRKIRDSFSDAAQQYEVLASLHKEIGRELSRKVIDNDGVESILDIGMGTGWLTNRLGFYLPESHIVGMDFARGMLEEAQKKWADFTVVQADAQALPFKDASFDILVSNLAYQWIADLPGAFSDNRRVLRENGKMYITMFGHDTFQEMFAALEQTRPVGPYVKTFRRLPSLPEVRQHLAEAGFDHVFASEEIIKVHFQDLLALLRWTKEIGANVLNPDVILGKEWLIRADEYYQTHYKDRFGVTATFSVIWLEGQKAAENIIGI
ncbi:MAG: methyltransferase domain-containing protein, partial [Candidatus Omnitrophica bacterium]|nr:methyltransferase domain-containing protein [Candidatus Omnitrophota bacterium]